MFQVEVIKFGLWQDERQKPTQQSSCVQGGSDASSGVTPSRAQPDTVSERRAVGGCAEG